MPEKLPDLISFTISYKDESRKEEYLLIGRDIRIFRKSFLLEEYGEVVGKFNQNWKSGSKVVSFKRIPEEYKMDFIEENGLTDYINSMIFF